MELLRLDASELVRNLEERLGLGSMEYLAYPVSGTDAKVKCMKAVDCPAFACCTYVTVGLSDFVFDVEGMLSRYELAACCMGTHDMGRLLAVAVAAMVRHAQAPVVGRAFSNLVRDSQLGDAFPEYPHVVFVEPAPWGDRFSDLHCDGCEIEVVYAMPVSESEYQVRRENGFKAFLEHVQKHLSSPR